MSHTTLDLDALVHQHGHRITAPRRLVLDTICALDDHVSANDLYHAVTARNPALSRATVYRGLAFWHQLGLITSTETLDGQVVYQIFHPHPHHHLVCRDCGCDIELPHHQLDGLFAGLLREYGFAADPHAHLTFFGTCAACRQKTTAGEHHAAR